ncbi:MAG: MDR family MFS transporter [Vicinamibacterales bacterium]
MPPRSFPRLVPDFRGLPRPFWVLFAGTLVNRVGGFVLIFLAIYLTEVQSLTPTQAGAVLSAYGLGAIAGGPIGGALSDRIGRRPTLVVSLIAGGVSMLVLGLVARTVTMTLAAVATGLLYEMYRPVVAATVADVVRPDDRPRAFGLIHWAVNLGASVAPLLGGVIAASSYRALFAADAATTVLFGIILWVALPETRPGHLPQAMTVRGAARAMLRDHVFVAVCLLTLVFSVVFFQSFVGLPIDVRAHGISATGFAGLIALNAAMIVLLQPFASELIRDHSRASVLAVASVLLAVGFGMNAWIGSLSAYAVSVAVWTLGEILFSPASMALVADLAPTDLRGRYQGAFAVAFTGAFATAPLVGGYTLAHAGAYWLWIGCLVAGLTVAVGFLMVRRITPSVPHHMARTM